MIAIYAVGIGVWGNELAEVILWNYEYMCIAKSCFLRLNWFDTKCKITAFKIEVYDGWLIIILCN